MLEDLSKFCCRVWNKEPAVIKDESDAPAFKAKTRSEEKASFEKRIK